MDDCSPLYMRYMGSKFPDDVDVSIDGLTAGKFFGSSDCGGLASPEGSPFGICRVCMCVGRACVLVRM